MATFSASPAFPRLSDPVVPTDVFVAPATLDAARGRAAVEHAVKDGFLKPIDIGAVDLEEPALLYVPFWSVDVSAEGQKSGTVMICARTSVPYEPKLPSLFGAIGSNATSPLNEVGMNDLFPVNAEAAREALAGAEVVDADVDRARSEAIASGLLLHAASPTHAFYAKFEPKVRASTFSLYPVYYARYRYEGEARRHAGEDFYVAVSGRSGDVIAAKHPSAVRAMANKLRKLLSFDFR